MPAVNLYFDFMATDDFARLARPYTKTRDFFAVAFF